MMIVVFILGLFAAASGIPWSPIVMAIFSAPFAFLLLAGAATNAPKRVLLGGAIASALTIAAFDGWVWTEKMVLVPHWDGGYRRELKDGLGIVLGLFFYGIPALFYATIAGCIFGSLPSPWKRSDPKPPPPLFSDIRKRDDVEGQRSN